MYKRVPFTRSGHWRTVGPPPAHARSRLVGRTAGGHDLDRDTSHLTAQVDV